MKLTRAFVDDIRELIVSARNTVARGVDLVQVHTNFEIGRRIVEQEQRGKDRATYGNEVIKVLAARLSAEFGNGFSKSNLEYMRRFYALYQERSPIAQTASGRLPAHSAQGKRRQAQTGDLSIAQTPSGQSIAGSKTVALRGRRAASPQRRRSTDSTHAAEPASFRLSWSHYVLLLGVKDADERSFYEIEAAQQQWTVRELRRQFDSSLYERLALSRDKQGIRRLAREGQVVRAPQDVLKEPLVLEFLGLGEQTRYSESDLEAAIIGRIEHFLLELGKGFLFEARQKRFTFDGEHFFVDLVFYNRLLRCYVLIDLKLGRLTHQDLGQMQMYVNYFDRHVAAKDERATVGIVLCKKKNEALVEITLPRGANIHAREYQLYLPSKAVLRRKLTQWAEEARGG